MAKVDGFVSTAEDPELLLEKIDELLPTRATTEPAPAPEPAFADVALRVA